MKPNVIEQPHEPQAPGVPSMEDLRRGVLRLEYFTEAEVLSELDYMKRDFLRQFEKPGGPLFIHPKDGTVMGLVPAGTFLAGDEKFSVALPAYYLGLHPVTNGQYAQFLSETKPTKGDLENWIQLDSTCFVRASGKGYEGYGGKADHPVVQVSWYGAEAYCQWSGLRLPSELEWEKASRGLDGREYPWGKEWNQDRCRNANNDGNEQTCGIWSYPEGCSPFGHYQMSGNVWEWCADWYDSNAYVRYKRGDLTPPTSGSGRVLRGGSWYNYSESSFRCALRNYHRDLVPTYRLYLSLCGFRCARTFAL